MSKTFTAQDMQNYADYVAKAVLSNIQPDLAHWYAEWHKTAKKVIDLSVLIESGIDCEFSDESEFLCMNTRIANLRVVDRGPSWYASNSPNQYLYCRPRMNHIHAWQGGECPLPEGFLVRVWRRAVAIEDKRQFAVEHLHWSYTHEDDIIAFEVLGLADGYVMPWEKDND